MNIKPYGVAVTDAIASGDLSRLKEAEAAAQAHLDEYGDIPTLLALLKVEIAKLEGKKSY
ncbi:DUF1843 domain-containing protein [Caulobacter flavus]|jgi:hypothetical protein|uniref:DUF1843 domain-containing protein n=1 Tax=Caulobacter flavus TaxID=1679497 RepID=A0A2N5CUL8_9CAUL|nr:DUF1843 domain-containing protein [Caulobacter flavus]AYV47779.1 DUF1843 domain-containing protein [Caulobacter flavus]PLR16962.1 DUF1843 domain-containing protein [Caulobacter flavus]